ncbi:MAG: EF-hand domain-containing protein [Rhodobacterales bacterium]|nr:EF-hand domain-containing protein [Rhodobacterales bacterium]
MKTMLMTSAAVLALAAPSWAASVSDLDTNGDGAVTLEEVQAAAPDVTAEEFEAMDTNADGSLSDEELGAAQQ